MNIDTQTVIATFILPFGKWVIETNDIKDSITIRKTASSGFGARRVLLVDAGEVKE